MRPIKKIVIHHSITPRDLDLMKSIKSFDRTHAETLHKTVNSLGYHIAYHLVIGGDGRSIMTRDYDEVGYHASDYRVNCESIGICLTGNFDEEYPSDQQYTSLAKIIVGLWDQFSYDITLHGHKEFNSHKTCPGTNFNFLSLKRYLMQEMGFYEAQFKQKYIKSTYIIDVEGLIKKTVNPDGTLNAKELVYAMLIALERVKLYQNPNK